jgi:dTDP-L-rhamnose 4-epimerase
VPIRKIAEHISDALGIRIAPEAKGEFRPGEMRHLTSDTARIGAAGYKPQVDLPEGIGRYLDWIRGQADVRDYFSEAENVLRAKGIVHRVETNPG